MNFIGLTRVMRVGTSNIVYLYKVEMAAVIVHCESVVFTNTNKTIKYHSRFCFPFGMDQVFVFERHGWKN